MQEDGKVKNLVKRFDKGSSSNLNYPYGNDVPTKDTEIYQPSKDIKISKLVTSEGQDEISVTIDVGEYGDTDYMPNYMSKGTPRTMNSIPQDSGISSLADHDKSRGSVFSNQLNFSLPPISQTGGKGQNPVPKLSPWLSEKINNNFAVPEISTNSKTRSLGVDTFELNRIREEEIRALKAKINDLECQIKIKDREIETSNWIDKEMHKRLQTTGDIFFVKNQAKDLQRKLDVQERLNQDLTADNGRLYEEINKKDRTILELQSEVNNLDRIIANNKFIHENEESKRILEDIDMIRSELMDKDKQVNEDQQKISNLQREIEKKNTELQFKNMKMEEVIAETRQSQREMALLDQKNYKILDSLSAVERENNVIKRELLRFEDFEMKWQELEDENMYLKQTIQDLEDQYRILEKRQDSSYQVNSLLDELRQALTEKNRATDERNQLLEDLRLKEYSLKDRTSEEKATLKEINQLKKFIRELEEENALYRRFEKEAENTEIQLRESERDKNALESQLIQLKPKIQKLQVKSLEKDHLITQLVQELKSQIGYLPADLRKEISKNGIASTQNNDQEEVTPT